MKPIGNTNYIDNLQLNFRIFYCFVKRFQRERKFQTNMTTIFIKKNQQQQQQQRKTTTTK